MTRLPTTPLRVVSNMRRMPVCIRNGWSSRTRNWLNWMPNAGWNVLMRNVSAAISSTRVCIARC